jgi:hypothetical protein
MSPAKFRTKQFNIQKGCGCAWMLIQTVHRALVDFVMRLSTNTKFVAVSDPSPCLVMADRFLNL